MLIVNYGTNQRQIIDERVERPIEKFRVTSTVGTRSSIAVRRPEGSDLADMIFVAQVENGNAIIRSAEVTEKLKDMVFTELLTLPNVSELSLMFDGFMKQRSNEIVEAYTVGEQPYIFYVDQNSSLKFINLDNESAGSISDNAVNVASTRGLYAEAIDLDDGIWIFYTNTLGELWEARMLNGEIIELSQITNLPPGVAGWVDVWAGLTFDYRIVLQIKGNDGNVYTLISKSRPSGYSLNEYLKVEIEVVGKIGLIPPVLLTVENVGVV